ncbi:hypothetical protein ACTXT7_013141 [Hymenolepis weldensis]
MTAAVELLAKRQHFLAPLTVVIVFSFAWLNERSFPPFLFPSPLPFHLFFEQQAGQKSRKHMSTMRCPKSEPHVIPAKLMQTFERLPKWSVLRRSESNPISPPQPSLRPSASAELLNQISRRSPERQGEEEGYPHYLVANTTVTTVISSRDSPQTPPISVFDRRRSWFTSRAAPGVTRPRVLKHGPVLPLDLVASRNSDLNSLKRSATNGRNSYEESIVKKSRVHSLVPSERSAFLPVAHSGCRRQTDGDGLIDASSTVLSLTPSNCSSISMVGDDSYDGNHDQERNPLNLLPPPSLPSNSI